MDNKNEQTFSDELKSVFSFIKEKLITENPTDQITIEYFMLSILENKNSDTYKAFQNCTKTESLDKIHNFYLNYVHENSKTFVRPNRKIKNDDNLDKIIKESDLEKDKFKDSILSTEHVLLNILSHDLKNKNILETAGISYDSFYNEINKIRENKKRILTEKQPTKQIKLKTQFLDKNSKNINSLSNERKIDKLYGRKNEIKKLSTILCKRNNNCALIVGEKGCGKTELVYGIADLIQKNEITGFFEDKVIFVLDMFSLVSGAQMRGMIEVTIRNIFKELESNKNALLFIDDIHQIFNSGANNADIADAIESMIENTRVPIIASTTFSQIKYLEKNTNILDSRFTKIDLPTFNETETFELIKQNKKYWEKHHGVEYCDDVIKESVRLAKKYVTEKVLPVSAIDIIDQCGAEQRGVLSGDNNDELNVLKDELNKATGYKKYYLAQNNIEQSKNYELIEKTFEAKILELQSKEEPKKVKITIDNVKEAASVISKIDLAKINQSEHEMLRDLSENLKNKVIGQDFACDSVSNAIRKYRLGISDPNRPLSFLMIGQSGVGKTYLAKKLSELVFGNEEDMIRLDMSEYSESHSVSKLIGAPPGYVGFEDGGKLIELIKNKKRCVLLLDEIEKAHKNVYNMFLQLLDDGRLTSSFGEVVSFKDVIIILTSNVGTNIASQFGSGSGFVKKDGNEESIIKKELSKQFPPEFLNRLNSVVFFNKLNDSDLLRIIRSEINKTSQRMYENGIEVEISIEFENKVLELCKKETGMGARPILRAIQKLLEDTVCDAILKYNHKHLDVEIINNEVSVTTIY